MYTPFLCSSCHGLVRNVWELALICGFYCYFIYNISPFRYFINEKSGYQYQWWVTTFLHFKCILNYSLLGFSSNSPLRINCRDSEGRPKKNHQEAFGSFEKDELLHGIKIYIFIKQTFPSQWPATGLITIYSF